MTEIWTFRLVELVEPPDLTGFDVEALDGHIGKVDEATYEGGASCVVVDTGWWIFGKRRMVPAGVVERVDVDERKVHVRLTKDQIRDAPDYEPERHHEGEYRDHVGSYYRGI
jgi:hypothetical protein